MWAVEYFDHTTYTTRLVTSDKKPVVFTRRKDADTEARGRSRGVVFNWYSECHGWDDPKLGYTLENICIR